MITADYSETADADADADADAAMQGRIDAFIHAG
jgi:hypothetical protein